MDREVEETHRSGGVRLWELQQRCRSGRSSRNLCFKRVPFKRWQVGGREGGKGSAVLSPLLSRHLERELLTRLQIWSRKLRCFGF